MDLSSIKTPAPAKRKPGDPAVEPFKVNRISVVIPVYNGSTTIGPLVERLATELGAAYDLEVILVNDCSPTDNSAEVCRGLALSRPWVKFINLARNMGEHNAVMAGLFYCTGDCAVIMDDDFQNPPSEVGKLILKLQEGYDCVFSSYEKKRHHPFRNVGSQFNNLVAGIRPRLCRMRRGQLTPRSATSRRPANQAHPFTRVCAPPSGNCGQLRASTVTQNHQDSNRGRSRTRPSSLCSSSAPPRRRKGEAPRARRSDRYPLSVSCSPDARLRLSRLPAWKPAGYRTTGNRDPLFASVSRARGGADRACLHRD